MEGTLLKKTKNGVWHERQFKLHARMLTWLHSDNKSTETIDLSKGPVEIKDIKFGTKKYMFEIAFQGDSVSLSASGEAEKQAWISALKLATGKADEGIFQPSGAGRPSVRAIGQRAPIGGAAGPRLPLPGGAKFVPPASTAGSVPSTPTPSTPTLPSSAVAASKATVASAPATPTAMTPVTVKALGMTADAMAKLQAKMGTSAIPAPAANLCGVCGLVVYQMERLIVDKALMHKRCFRCAHCNNQLTLGSFASVNSTLYCKVHYFELFAKAGGKYDKAFGDGGFQHKASLGYTPPTPILAKVNPVAGKSVATSTEKPPIVVAAAAALPDPKPRATSPSVVSAAKKALEEPKPVQASLQAAVVVPGADSRESMATLMQKVGAGIRMPGEKPPSKPKPSTVESEESPVVQETPKTPTEEISAPAEAPATPTVENEAPSAENPVEEQSAAAETKSDEAKEPEAPVQDPVAVEAVAELPVPEPVKAPRMPVGPNFAMEAMRKRQEQLAKQGMLPMPEPAEDVVFESGRHSIRVGGIDHSAILAKPKMAGGRRAPKREEVGKMLPKAEIDRMTHDFTFRIALDGKKVGENVLWVHATSKFERDHWIETLSAAVQAAAMRADLESAQKQNMMMALNAQMALDGFLADNTIVYSGFLEKLSLKSHRNWKKRYFDLNEKGVLMYSQDEKSKKPKASLQLLPQTIIMAADGERLNAAVVVTTSASGVASAIVVDDASGTITAEARAAASSVDGAAEIGELPANFAVFDGEVQTIDLNVLVEQELATPSPPASTARDLDARTMQETAVNEDELRGASSWEQAGALVQSPGEGAPDNTPVRTRSSPPKSKCVVM